MMWWPFAGAGWMIIWMVVFWGGLIALIVWGAKKLARGSSTQKRSPLEIAKERYARGEISREEFEQIKKNLTSS